MARWFQIIKVLGLLVLSSGRWNICARIGMSGWAAMIGRIAATAPESTAAEAWT